MDLSTVDNDYSCTWCVTVLKKIPPINAASLMDGIRALMIGFVVVPIAYHSLLLWHFFLSPSHEHECKCFRKKKLGSHISQHEELIRVYCQGLFVSTLLRDLLTKLDNDGIAY